MDDLQLNIFSTGDSSDVKKQQSTPSRFSKKAKYEWKKKKNKDTPARDSPLKGTNFEDSPLKGMMLPTPSGKMISLSPKKSQKTGTAKRPSAQKPGAGRKHANAKSGEVISSLFRTNPDIPKVIQREVKRVEEAIFSETSFKDLELHPFLVKNLVEQDKQTATAVQARAVPSVLSGRDVLVKSQTGSGKTLCYALPVVQRLQSLTPRISRSDGLHALVIVPSRELAVQTLEVFKRLCSSFIWVVPGIVTGGERRKAEKARLRKGLNILVATPGRILDHLQHTDSLNLARVQFLVLDEADRTLELGYEKSIEGIVTALEEKKGSGIVRQTILLSATLTEGVQRLAGMSLRDPVRLDLSEGVEGAKETFAVPSELKHQHVTVPSKLRLVTLMAFLLGKFRHDKNSSKVVVFMSTQDAVEFHYLLFQQALKDTLLFKLYGNMPQKERLDVFNRFRVAATGVLLCTDVSARGLDLPRVEWIIQYTPPSSPTDYIHRAGRTARAGASGHALLFLTPSQLPFLDLLSTNGVTVDEVGVDTILSGLMDEWQRFEHPDAKEVHTTQEAATRVHMWAEHRVSSDSKLNAASVKAYTSYVRGYATYPLEVRHIFSMRDLHLGHTAKSFALRQAPKQIGADIGKRMAGEVGGRGRKRPGKEEVMSLHQLARKKVRSGISEFDSGVTSKKKKKKEPAQD